MCLFENMCECALCVCPRRPEKGTINGTGMKDGVSYQECAGNQTRGLCNSSKYS